MTNYILSAVFFLLLIFPPSAKADLEESYYLINGWKSYPLVQLDETKKDYFIDGKVSETYRYKVDREGLRDTFNIRRRLVNIFKPAYMREQARINFGQWLSLEKSGYCFSPSKAKPEDEPMAMDVITKNGFITEIVVGAVASCEDTTVDQNFKNRFRKQKKQKPGGGC